MLRSIIAQLCRKSSAVPDEAACILENSYKIREIPDHRKLLTILSMLAEEVDRVWIIVDALDECQSSEVLFKILSGILDMNKKGNLHVFVSSRDLVDFRREMAGEYSATVTIGNYGDADSDTNMEDIERFIDTSISERHHLKIQPDNIKAKIRETLTDKAEGM